MHASLLSSSRHYCGTTVSGTVLLLFFFSAGSAAGWQADRPRPLNIVFLLADDLGWGEVGCYGQEKIPTPSLDRLAREGMRWTQHYSGAPVCAPSRCVLMTGLHLGHAEVRGNLQAKKVFPQFDEGQYPLSEQAITVADVFQKAGYATGAFGKWGLGPVGSSGDPNLKGFDLFFGYNCQAVAHSYYPRFLWRNGERVILNAKPIPANRKLPEGEVQIGEFIGENHAPTRMIEESLAFLDQHRAEPFFLYLPFIEPHVAMHPPAASVERFPPEWDDLPYRGESGYLPHPRPRAGYAAMISDLDRYVGQVLDAIDAAGLTENTLVVFTSDNGTTHGGNGGSRFGVGGVDQAFFNSTRGLRGFKGSVYEGGLRVPMIARLPGRIPAGTVNSTPSYFADWFPTLCDAAALELPAGLDGRSLWPDLTGAAPAVRDKPMVWVFPEYGGQVAIRIGDHKFLRRNLSRPKPDPWEVYNIAEDPGEKTDLAAEQKELLQQAIRTLKQETSPNAVFPVVLPDDT